MYIEPGDLCRIVMFDYDDLDFYNEYLFMLLDNEDDIIESYFCFGTYVIALKRLDGMMWECMLKDKKVKIPELFLHKINTEID